MWPDVIVGLLIHVISTVLEDDEPGQPKKLNTRHETIRVSLKEAVDQGFVMHDGTTIDACGVRPRWTHDMELMKAWAFTKVFGGGLAFDIVRAANAGEAAKAHLEGFQFAAAIEWRYAHRASVEALRLASKVDIANRGAIETALLERQRKKTA